MSAVMGFVIFVLTCTLNTYIHETLFNDIGYFEAIYEAIRSLPKSVLTGTMSTCLIKWSGKMLPLIIRGGLIMINDLRDNLKRNLCVKSRAVNTKHHSEWV